MIIALFVGLNSIRTKNICRKATVHGRRIPVMLLGFAQNVTKISKRCLVGRCRKELLNDNCKQ